MCTFSSGKDRNSPTLYRNKNFNIIDGVQYTYISENAVVIENWDVGSANLDKNRSDSVSPTHLSD